MKTWTYRMLETFLDAYFRLDASNPRNLKDYRTVRAVMCRIWDMCEYLTNRSNRPA